MLQVSDLAQVAGGLIVVFGYIPQIVRVVRARSALGLSLAMWASVFVGVLLMEIYAVDLALDGEPMMLLTNSASLVLSGTLLALILWYRTFSHETSLTMRARMAPRVARTKARTRARVEPQAATVRAAGRRAVLITGILRRI
jgi:MtN3 and saliva related transmembrane protein